MPCSWADEEILLALSGDQKLIRRFSRDLIAKLHLVVGIQLRHRPDTQRLLIEDLIQSVLAYMVENNWRVLRLWTPTRGLSFCSFVALVARRRVSRLLQRTRPLDASELIGGEEIRNEDAESSFEQALMHSLRLAEVLSKSDSCKISERDRRIVRQVWLHERDREEICREENISRVNIDQIIKRCRDKLSQCIDGP